MTTPTFRTVFVAAALLASAGCSSSKPESPVKGAAKAAPTSKASVPTAAPINRWLRPAPKEPHPVAKGLYRRATTLVHAGDLAGAQPLFKQILREHPQSRFARRLQTEGFPIVEAAKMATVFVMFGGAALLFSADGARP